MTLFGIDPVFFATALAACAVMYTVMGFCYSMFELPQIPVLCIPAAFGLGLAVYAGTMFDAAVGLYGQWQALLLMTLSGVVGAVAPWVLLYAKYLVEDTCGWLANGGFNQRPRGLSTRDQ